METQLLSLPGIQDRVRTASTVAALREPTFQLCDRMQDIDPANQVRALFLAAAVTAMVLRLDPHEELLRAHRLMRQAEGPFTSHVQALRDYVEGELLRRPE